MLDKYLLNDLLINCLPHGHHSALSLRWEKVKVTESTVILSLLSLQGLMKVLLDGLGHTLFLLGKCPSNTLVIIETECIPILSDPEKQPASLGYQVLPL